MGCAACDRTGQLFRRDSIHRPQRELAADQGPARPAGPGQTKQAATAPGCSLTAGPGFSPGPASVPFESGRGDGRRRLVAGFGQLHVLAAGCFSRSLRHAAPMNLRSVSIPHLAPQGSGSGRHPGITSLEVQLAPRLQGRAGPGIARGARCRAPIGGSPPTNLAHVTAGKGIGATRCCLVKPWVQGDRRTRQSARAATGRRLIERRGGAALGLLAAEGIRATSYRFS